MISLWFLTDDNGKIDDIDEARSLNNIFANTYYENRILNNEPVEKQRPKLVNVSYPCKAFWEIVSHRSISPKF